MRFVFLDSRFTFHTSSPRSVALAQLCFPSLAVVSLREDLHLQDRAHAGHTHVNEARQGAPPSSPVIPGATEIAAAGYPLPRCSASVVFPAQETNTAPGSGRRGALRSEVKEESRVKPGSGDMNGAECPVGLISRQCSPAFLLLA